MESEIKMKIINEPLYECPHCKGMGYTNCDTKIDVNKRGEQS